ncbi:MAG: hypothetical protein CMB64_07615 [Euryarchaeota archaeon]|nr:hypothetical protein [Euryarchaeota archaeon]|tara:strand:- start:191 stop:730 length:540 start_codon:yes stop_codon:yes gene_type:complete
MRIAPLVIGIILILITITGLIGYGGSGEAEVPVIPCPTNPLEPDKCNVGMTLSDLEVPTQYSILSIKISIEWSQSESTWVAVIPSSDATECPPDEIGLTSCEAEDLNFISGGTDSVGADGLQWDVEPGKYRLATGSISSQANSVAGNIVNYDYDVRLNLLVASVTLLFGSCMIFAGVEF